MRLLFVCTHNRCRSILSEAITNSLASPLLVAASAGSQPAEEVHPGVLTRLDSAGIPVAGLHSKSWEAVADFAPDLVITLCDSAAGEACPLWMGDCPRYHWPLADPSRELDEKRADQAFAQCMAAIRQRTGLLRSLPLARMTGAELAEQLSRFHG